MCSVCSFCMFNKSADWLKEKPEAFHRLVDEERKSKQVFCNVICKVSFTGLFWCWFLVRATPSICR